MSFREKSILAGILVLCLIVLLPIGYRFIKTKKKRSSQWMRYWSMPF